MSLPMLWGFLHRSPLNCTEGGRSALMCLLSLLLWLRTKFILLALWRANLFMWQEEEFSSVSQRKKQFQRPFQYINISLGHKHASNCLFLPVPKTERRDIRRELSCLSQNFEMTGTWMASPQMQRKPVTSWWSHVHFTYCQQSTGFIFRNLLFSSQSTGFQWRWLCLQSQKMLGQAENHFLWLVQRWPPDQRLANQGQGDSFWDFGFGY